MPCLDTAIARGRFIMDRRDYLAADVADTADTLQAAIDNEEPAHVIEAARVAHVEAVISHDDYANGPDLVWLYCRDLDLH